MVRTYDVMPLSTFIFILLFNFTHTRACSNMLNCFFVTYRPSSVGSIGLILTLMKLLALILSLVLFPTSFLLSQAISTDQKSCAISMSVQPGHVSSLSTIWQPLIRYENMTKKHFTVLAAQGVFLSYSHT